jgi:hypothetical protein
MPPSWRYDCITNQTQAKSGQCLNLKPFSASVLGELPENLPILRAIAVAVGEILSYDD